MGESSQKTRTISLHTAMFVSLNLMLGGGMFVNIDQLNKLVGPWSFMIYIIAGILLYPVILSIGHLGQTYPVSGGLYTYSEKQLGRNYGFITCWGYFLAKTVSYTLLLHVVSRHITHSIIPSYQPYTITIALISLVYSISIIGIGFNTYVQTLIIIIKLFPIISSILIGIQLFNGSYILQASFQTYKIIEHLPLGIYALSGYEIITSIGGLIAPPASNINKAISRAFFIAIITNIIFLLIVTGALGAQATTSSNQLLLLGNYFSIGSLINTLVYLAIGLGSFTMFVSNAWNLHSLAYQDFFPYKTTLISLNRYKTPWICLMIQALISCSILTLTQNIAALQNISTAVLFIAFFLTMCACFRSIKETATKQLSPFVPLIAAAICCSIIILCVYNIIIHGLSFSFITLFLSGLSLALHQGFRKKYSKKHTNLHN